jgi:hypothetical protein
MWGSSKFQSLEEYKLGADIDEITNVYCAGAFAFALFGNYNRTQLLLMEKPQQDLKNLSIKLIMAIVHQLLCLMAFLMSMINKTELLQKKL